jgi:arginase family enzyme
VGTHPIHPGYAGIPTFFQAPYVELDGVRDGTTVVAGVPIDQGIITAKPGARFGPRAVREASQMPRAILAANVEHTWVDVDTGVALRLKDQLSLVDVGDFDIDPTDIMKTTWSVVEGVEAIVKRGGLPVVLGGDHYIAYPCFEGFVRGMSARKEGLRVGYLHVDTHSDFRFEYGPLGRYNHATAARRVSENGAASYRNMAWLGLNGSVLDAEMYRTFRRNRLKMVTARMIRERGAREAVRDAMEGVASGVDAVYLTVDIDVVNGSEARGTGAPVFAGIDARTFLEMMEALSEYDIIRAIDLCEVAPGLDPSGTTADLAVAGLLTLLERRVFDRVDLGE